MPARVIKLTLEYDGTNYAGWQLQPDVATVQGVIEEALAKVLGTPTRLHCAGRTDAGVHAAGQVAHFATDHTIPAAAVARALNALLPDDIHILAAEEAPPDFHARYAAAARTYRYRITYVDSVFTRRHAYYVPRPLDVAAMREAAAHLIGEHDFAAFGNASEDYTSTVRRLEELRVDETLDGVELYFTASAFLYKMVRNVVAVLVKVGAGEIPPTLIGELLATRARRALGPPDGDAVWPPAPPHGLTLLRVRYGN